MNEGGGDRARSAVVFSVATFVVAVVLPLFYAFYGSDLRSSCRALREFAGIANVANLVMLVILVAGAMRVLVTVPLSPRVRTATILGYAFGIFVVALWLFGSVGGIVGTCR